MSGFEEKLKRYCGMTEKYLDGLFTENTSYETLLDAMRYSLMAGGKRLRPALLDKRPGVKYNWRCAHGATSRMI